MNSKMTGYGALLIGFAALASAQTTFPLQILVTQSGQSVTQQNGDTVSMTSHIGQPQIAHVVITYSGTGVATITGAPVLVGSLFFTEDFSATVPLTLTPGQSYAFDIQFLPTSAAQAVGQLNQAFQETLTVAGVATTTPYDLRLQLLGTAPQFVISYSFASSPNTIPLPSGGGITFPATLTSTTAQATLSFTNTGTGLGTINSITITGNAFKLSGLPLFPDGVPASQALGVQILYTPTGAASDTGQITVNFAVDGTVTIPLQGSSSAATFTYQILQTGSQTSVAPGGTINFPQTQTGQSSSLVIRVLNSGNASGTISLVNVIGTGFALTPTPLLPQTIAPNAAATFTVAFTPTLPGAATGTLLVNSDSFTLSGLGLGSQLTYSYTAAGNSITIGTSNTSVVFTPVQISQSAQLTFDIKNTGTQAAVLSNIGVAQVPSPFVVSGLPSLPVNLAPNSDLQFTITFTPTALGFTSGSLQVDAAQVPLIGSGTAPPPLPAYTITGASGTVAPLTQPSITLTLASAYPVAISGTLTLSSSGSLPADPAVQFSSGGLTVAFTIPANATSAVFGNAGTQIGLQTGTNANTVTITPSFAVSAGGVSLTPTPVVTAQFTVPAAAPVLIGVVATTGTTTGSTSTVSLDVTGLTTTRTLTSWTVQFTPIAGVSMPVSKFTANIQPIASTWFGSTASQAYGSQFSLTLPFTFQGLPTGQPLTNVIDSVSVTVTNESGTSNVVQAQLQ